MPIYEYQCAACGEKTEVIQKFAEAPLEICPACGKSQLRKQVSAPAFQLKGSGWYVTDFRNSGKPKSAGEKAAAGADGGEGKATGGDSSSSKQEPGDSASKKADPAKSAD
ncbi:MAG: zinc ribbon domain-containing protein [Gammaproteobacteria bacterium]|nr:zinc ribbon domain-containing protein [Gammaproteobacteria bacterium]